MFDTLDPIHDIIGWYTEPVCVFLLLRSSCYSVLYHEAENTEQFCHDFWPNALCSHSSSVWKSIHVSIFSEEACAGMQNLVSITNIGGWTHQPRIQVAWLRWRMNLLHLLSLAAEVYSRTFVVSCRWLHRHMRYAVPYRHTCSTFARRRICQTSRGRRAALGNRWNIRNAYGCWSLPDSINTDSAAIRQERILECSGKEPHCIAS